MPALLNDGRNSSLWGMAFLLSAALILTLGSPQTGESSEASEIAQGTPRPETPDFATEVRPLLARRCFACHGNDEETREAGLRLDSFAEATLDRDGFPAIVPGKAHDSELILRVTDEFDPMPPEETGDPLTEAEVDVLTRWINSGAEYAPHWAFTPPLSPAVEAVAGVEPIDALVAAQHAARGLTWSPEADDFTLFRRISLDLTGLPPTPEAAQAYAASTDPLKFTKAVDELLDSPAYAERWTAVWLDLARYADSSGHGSDPLRTIWRYRDWVIEAFDKNMPFDEFTVHQLAGDLLPDATDNTRLATAFHRNTMTNTEGGTDDEEFRVLAVKDRVNTTMSVWMGLTAGCAECHSHKFDPISHEEYYQLFDIFNQTADTDKNDDRPRLATPSVLETALLAELEAKLDAAEAELAGYFSSADPMALREKELELLARAGAVDWTPGPLVLPDAEADAEVAQQTVSWEQSAGPFPTALRLDALTDPSMPGKGDVKGPGQSEPNGNFVLTELNLRAARIGAAPIEAATVRLELPGDEKILSLAEVELIDAGGAVIPGAFRSATQSSTAYNGSPDRAIDGITSGEYGNASVTHSETESDPWWEGTLASPQAVAGVRVWPRTDGSLEERTHGFRVRLLDGDGNELWRSALAPAPPGSGDRDGDPESGDPESNGSRGPDAPWLDVGPVAGEPLLLGFTNASHGQREFEGPAAVDGLRSTMSGWGVGGAEGRDQVAVLALPEVTSSAAGPGGWRFTATLRQDFGDRHLLGRWQLSTAQIDKTPHALTPMAQVALAKASEDRSPDEFRAVLDAHRSFNSALKALQKARDAAAESVKSFKATTTPVMVELPADQRRATHVLTRGNFLQKAEEVNAAVPAAFPPLPDGVEPDRLALAKWLVSEGHPLTARVTVNRVWARLFGRGLVRTEGDFGSQGDLPTHPRLLDWLSVKFQRDGWDHKALLRTIVTSRTYRQSSNFQGASASADPEAVWLSRFPRQRLEAEMVRDTALEVSGLLSRKRFGPSVFPPQPEGLWKAAFNNQRDWSESMGEDRYRRGLYVFLRRTIPYPMLATFDAPSRETCTVRRIPTNTPLQAFVTLNDPVFVEASQALAQRALLRAERHHGEGASAQRVVEEMLWCGVSRAPEASQVNLALALFEDARDSFASDPDAALEFGFTAPDELEVPAPELAAWTLVASAVLNLDSVLTKE